MQSVVFLMYHELELPNRPLCGSDPGYKRYVIPLEQFRAEMSVLQRLGICGLSVSEALKFSRSGVAITVDDGCETDLLAIAPELKEFGFSATFYITVAFIGRPGFLSAAQLRELSGGGFEIGCHSMTHAYLTDVDDAQLEIEIADSRNLLEQLVGRPIEHFSCPGGRFDSRAVRVAQRAGYRTLAASIPRANSRSCDLFSLGRAAVTRGLKDSSFQKLCRGEDLWKLGLTSALRDQAKRILGNRSYERIRDLFLHG